MAAGSNYAWLHRCLQAWAYQGNAQAVGAPYTSDFINNRPHYNRNNAIENHLLAMPRHSLFSIGAIVHGCHVSVIV